MLYKQKGNFQKVVRWVAGSWMTANQATFFGLIAVCLVAACFYAGLSVPGWRWALLLVPVFLLMRMVMNTLDGLLAREYRTATVTGELWNEGLDIIGDTVAYGSLFFVPNAPGFSLTVFLIATWAAEYFGVLGKSLPGGVRRHETLGGGKPDRAVWMGLFALIAFFRPGFEPFLPQWLAGVSVLVVLTVAIRIRKIVVTARGKKYRSFTWIGR